MSISIIRRSNININEVNLNIGNCKFHENNVMLNFENENQLKINLLIQINSNILNKIIFKANNNNNLDILGIYYSNDNINWTKMLINNVIRKNDFIYVEFPLYQIEYIHIIFNTKNEKNISITLNNQTEINTTCNNNLDRLWISENLIDLREDYGWSSLVLNENHPININFDLNTVYYLNQIKLRSIKNDNDYFPKKFIIEISLDNLIWHNIVSEENFYTTSFAWYQWIVPIQKCRYIKLTILENNKIKKDEYVSKILDIDLICIPENFIEKLLNKKLEYAYASELIPGVVKLAENLSTKPQSVVQGNDSRLRTATTEYPGLTQLAKDSENRAGVVVQGNDSRLRTATTEYPGLTQLAKDSENRAGVVVQGNDSRLRTATTEYPGLTQLAKDSENRAGVVVQGNDSRLRTATTEYPGLTQLAKHNEISVNKVILSDDPRLLEGNEIIKGRVGFAKDGEISSLKAVQSNDHRIQPASIESYGIVKIATNGHSVKNCVVESTDSRLNDARIPLPHVHAYAEQNHEFNTHKGNLNINMDCKIPYPDGYYFNAMTSMPLSVINSLGPAIAANGGIVSFSEKQAGLISFSNQSFAIDARGKLKPGAIIISENDYSVILPKQHQSIKSSGKSLLAEGLVHLKGGLAIEGMQSISIKLDTFENEAYANGDMLTINEYGKIEKIKKENQPFFGIYQNNSDFIFSEKTNLNLSILVSILGIVKIRVTGKIKAGDSVEFSKGNPGVGMKSNRPIFSIICLEKNDEASEKLVKCLIR